MRRLSKFFAMMLTFIMTVTIGLTGCGKKNPSNERLDMTDSITYFDETLSWSAVSGAQEYEVTVYDGGTTTVALEKQTVKTTSLGVSSLEAGEYTAGVVATAEGKTSSEEKKYDFTVAAKATALPTPTGFGYADGKVTWGAVEGATAGYTVKVVVKSSSETVVEEKTVNAAQLDVSGLPAGTYTISVTANAVEGVSLASLAAAYDFTVAAVKTKLATPSGASLDAAARKITWTAVEGAAGYEVKATKGTQTLFEKTVTVSEADLSDVEESEFTFTVVAFGDEATTEKSDVYTYQVSVVAVKMEAPSGVGTDGAQNELFWNEVADSDAYRVIIKKGEETLVDEEIIETSLDISSLGAGTYAVTVQTLADPYDVFLTDSDETSYELTIASLGAYEVIADLRIDGGYIVWNENNALDYEVIVTEKGETQALDLGGVKAQDNKFMIAGVGLPTGNYTVSVTPKDNRHDSEEGETASYDISLTDVKTFDAAAIAAFDGNAPVGEHGKAELTERNGKQVAKVTPTVDGWGRVGSEEITVNYDKNPVLYIDIEDIEVGGFHAQVQIGGNNYKILDDGAKLADVAVKMTGGSLSSISGSKTTIIRLGVDNSSTTSANDAVAYYNSCRVLYITEYEDAFSGKLDTVGGFEISNGMDIAWGAVDNADSYYVTVKNNSDSSTVYAKAAQTGITFRARDLDEGEYTLTVSAFSSVNELAEESDEANYAFKVSYLANYSAEDISGFTNVLVGDRQSIAYDSDNDQAVYNSAKTYGYGAIAPETGISVNLSNRPFAIVDAARIDYGYLVRGSWTEEGSSTSSTLVLRNDTVVQLENEKLYIELWKRADQGDAPVYGSGTYAFGMGFLAGTGNAGQVVLNGIKIVEITEIEVLTPGAKTPLSAPSAAKESKGVISADPVRGNSEYTPKYSVTVSEKEGERIYTQSNLFSPSVDLAALSLTNGKTYVIAFKALGDNDYFVDSEEYSVEVTYTEVLAITDFSGLDYMTMADKKGGEAVLTGENGKLTSTVNSNNGWGYDFMGIDVSSVLDMLNAGKEEYYMQWSIDVENSTAGANIATRFYNPSSGEVVGTGWGDSDLSAAFLTKEWNDKIDADGIIWFAFGQGGATVAGASEKKVICSSIKFVKFTVNEIA